MKLKNIFPKISIIILAITLTPQAIQPLSKALSLKKIASSQSLKKISPRSLLEKFSPRYKKNKSKLPLATIQPTPAPSIPLQPTLSISDKWLKISVISPDEFQKVKAQLARHFTKKISSKIKFNLSNYISEMPEDLFESCAEHIECLDISNNALTRINLNLPNLKELNLENNKLTTLKLNSPNLKTLNLSQNLLEKFENKPNLPNLEELYLKDNLLSELTGPFPSLNMLLTGDNKIKKIKGYFPALRFLDAANNLVESIDGYFPKLATLCLANNQSLNEISVNLPSLRYLDLYGIPNTIDILSPLPMLEGCRISAQAKECFIKGVSLVIE